MALPFSEWTRAEKDEFAQRRMDEMKLINEKYKQRHAEVEQDRLKAEAKNSAVTSLTSLVKEKSATSEVSKAEVDAKPKVKEREWDRGKSDMDLENWRPSKHPPRLPSHWKGKSSRKDNWKSNEYYGSSSRIKGTGRTWDNRKGAEASNYRNESHRAEKGREFNRERSYRSFQNSKLNDSKKKACGTADCSVSHSPSDSEKEPSKQSTKLENDRMWRDGGMNEVRHRQSRVEKWVKSINNECLEGESLLAPKLENSEYQDKSWIDAENYTEDNWVDPLEGSFTSWKEDSHQYTSTPLSKSLKNKKGKYGKSKYENSNPSVEDLDDSVLVKIKGHTVKRTLLNSFCDAELEMPHSPENVQHNIMTQGTWGNSENKSILINTDEAEKLHSNGESEYSKIQKARQRIPVDSDNDSEKNLKFNNESSLNIESPNAEIYPEFDDFLYKQVILPLSNPERFEELMLIVNVDDNNNDGRVESRNIVHPEIPDGTVENGANRNVPASREEEKSETSREEEKSETIREEEKPETSREEEKVETSREEEKAETSREEGKAETSREEGKAETSREEEKVESSKKQKGKAPTFQEKTKAVAFKEEVKEGTSDEVSKAPLEKGKEAPLEEEQAAAFAGVKAAAFGRGEEAAASGEVETATFEEQSAVVSEEGNSPIFEEGQAVIFDAGEAVTFDGVEAVTFDGVEAAAFEEQSTAVSEEGNSSISEEGKADMSEKFKPATCEEDVVGEMFRVEEVAKTFELVDNQLKKLSSSPDKILPK